MNFVSFLPTAFAKKKLWSKRLEPITNMMELVKADNAYMPQLSIDGEVIERDVIIMPLDTKKSKRSSRRLHAFVLTVDLSRRIANHHFTEIPEAIKQFDLIPRYYGLSQPETYAQDVTITRQKSGMLELRGICVFM